MFRMGADRKCTKCSWTVLTGGMTREAHESLGHGPLVEVGAPPVSCKQCQQPKDALQNNSKCRYHNGSKDNFVREKTRDGSRTAFKWSCCGLAVDFSLAAMQDHPNLHATGCQSSGNHSF